MIKQPRKYLPISSAALILPAFLAAAWLAREAKDEHNWMFAGIVALLIATLAVLVRHIWNLGNELNASKQLQAALDSANAHLETRVAACSAELRDQTALYANSEIRLLHANRALRVIAKINETLHRAGDEAKLFHNVCNVLVETGGYRFCWIGQAEDDALKSVRPLACAGVEASVIAAAEISWDEVRGAGCPVGQAVRCHAPAALQDALHDPAFAPWRDTALRTGFASVLALPLITGDDGAARVLCVYSAEPDAFDSGEVELLQQLAADLSCASGSLHDQDALAQAKEQIALLLASLPLILYICRAEDNFGTTYISPNVEQVTGFAAECFLADAAFWSEHIHPDDRMRIFDGLQGLFKHVKLGHEYRWRVADGSYHWYYDCLNLVRNAEGMPSHIVGVWFDITDRKEAELELAAAKQEIEAAYAMLERKNRLLVDANRARFEFLSTLSHELKTPLNAIIGFSEMLKEGLAGELNAKQREFLQDIYDAGEKLLVLISEILEFTSLEAGHRKPDQDVVDARNLLAEAVEEFRARAAEAKIELAAEAPQDLKPSMLDAKAVRHILHNLLSNAIKFTPSGGQVRAALRAVPRESLQEKAGAFEQYLEFTISDTGIGIAPELQPKLFKPFSQTDGSVVRAYGGVGMGLAMVKRLAELNLGAVDVASEPGKGSRFTVWLPYRREFAEMDGGSGFPSAALLAAQAATKAHRVFEGTSDDLHPLVLVVEDDEQAAELICLQLHGEGLCPIVAHTAEKGLEMAETLRPALITLDILLPGMDGWRFLEQLKRNAILAQIPVVIISIVADQRRGMALGAARVIQKPYQRFELAEALAAAGFAPSPGERRSVLVVDDDPATVKVAAGLVKGMGFEVITANRGREGIELARTLRPDLIILDLMMPEVSGFDVARALHEHPDTAHIPILVATAKDLSGEERKELEKSVRSIVQKSAFDSGAFLTEVRRALAEHDGKE